MKETKKLIIQGRHVFVDDVRKGLIHEVNYVNDITCYKVDVDGCEHLTCRTKAKAVETIEHDLQCVYDRRLSDFLTVSQQRSESQRKRWMRDNAAKSQGGA